MKKLWWAVVVAGVAGLAGCGDDDGSSAAGEGVEAYCEAARRLDAATDELLGIEADTQEEIVTGFKRLFERNGDDLQDLVETAPAEIKEDVAKGVEAFRKAADGDFSGMNSFDDEKISAFDAEHCF